jgi:hypothetical protein
MAQLWHHLSTAAGSGTAVSVFFLSRVRSLYHFSCATPDPFPRIRALAFSEAYKGESGGSEPHVEARALVEQNVAMLLGTLAAAAHAVPTVLPPADLE